MGLIKKGPRIDPGSYPEIVDVGVVADLEPHAASTPGPTLGDLRYILHLFIFFCRRQQTQSAHEWPVDLVSGADFECNLQFFEPDPFRELPGPAVRPGGRDLSVYLPLPSKNE